MPMAMTFCLSRKILFCIRSSVHFEYYSRDEDSDFVDALKLFVHHVMSLEFPPSMQTGDVAQSHGT